MDAGIDDRGAPRGEPRGDAIEQARRVGRENRQPGRARRRVGLGADRRAPASPMRPRRRRSGGRWRTATRAARPANSCRAAAAPGRAPRLVQPSAAASASWRSATCSAARAACGRAAAAPRRHRTRRAATAASTRSTSPARPRECRRRSASAAVAAAPGSAPCGRNHRSSWGRRGRGGRRCATAANDAAPARRPSRSRPVEPETRAQLERDLGAQFAMIAAAALGDVVEQHRDIERRGATRSGWNRAVDSGWSSASSPRSIARGQADRADAECSSTV